jgi:hypothetical protein
MLNSIKQKNRWFIAAVLIACVPQIFSVVSLMRSTLMHVDVEPKTMIFAGNILALIAVLVLVKSKAWRLGFLCIIAAQSLCFLSMIIYSKSILWALIISLFSLFPLIPAISFFRQFKRAKNIQIYGVEYRSRYTVFFFLAIFILIGFLIFYLIGL